MNPNAYRILAAHENEGWYYRARVRVVQTLVDRYLGPERRDLRILDVGCGTGGTSRALATRGRVTGVEPSKLAIELLRRRFPELHVVRGTVQLLPSLVPPSTYDLATIMGVLYHRGVPDPSHALANVYDTLRPGGWIAWNEAAYPFLARRHDEFVDGARRFYPRQMHALLRRAGFEVHHGSHLLGWGFPIAAGLAFLHRLRARFTTQPAAEDLHDSPDDQLPHPWINAALVRLTYWQWRIAGRLPWGVSYLAFARKPLTARARPSLAA